MLSTTNKPVLESWEGSERRNIHAACVRHSYTHLRSSITKGELTLMLHTKKAALSLLTSLVLILLTVPAWGADKNKDEETIRNAVTVLQAMVGSKDVPASTVARILAAHSDALLQLIPGELRQQPRRASGCRDGSSAARTSRSGCAPGRRPGRSPSAGCRGRARVRSDVTTGIEPPQPISTAACRIPRRAPPARRAPTGCRCSPRCRASACRRRYSTVAPGGRRSATKRLNCSNTSSGSWSGTRRNETLADASEAITVLLPAPV